MSRIEVTGSFTFNDGEVTFAFGDKAYSFSEIAAMDQLRAVLVAIAQYGTEESIKAVLGKPSQDGEGVKHTPATAQGTYEKATEQVREVLDKAEHTFREHQRQTAEALQQAEKEYEIATANALKALQPTI